MPWKDTTDPYKIWLSEVILQQTRVAQGIPYYLKFIEHYPTVADLAAADIDDVLRDWQGLGYYSRARNLYFTAQTIVKEYDGVFPKTYKEVISLKGIGKYTAAAIMSFAYGERYPVVDGNVLRVISRLHGILEAVDDKQTIDKIYEYCEHYISHVDPALYNQAIMDLGALVCTPKNPKCNECPFSKRCLALSNDMINSIPYKVKKVKRTVRYLHYFDIRLPNNETIIHHRKKKGIWQGLYDLPMLELDSRRKISRSKIKNHFYSWLGDLDFELSRGKEIIQHKLTHQTLFISFHKVFISKNIEIEEPFVKVSRNNLKNYGSPIVVAKYLESSHQKL